MTTSSITELFGHNRAWAGQMERDRPGFFTGLVKQQKPKYMWIGCSDSRVPANQITGLEPGEVFVHRNVANIVVHSDLNALSAIQFAVEMLKVEHIMVVGHYGCGGVQAALDGTRIGLADNWIRHIQDVRDRHRAELAALPPERRVDALVDQTPGISANQLVKQLASEFDVSSQALEIRLGALRILSPLIVESG